MVFVGLPKAKFSHWEMSLEHQRYFPYFKSRLDLFRYETFLFVKFLIYYLNFFRLAYPAPVKIQHVVFWMV